MSWLKAGLYVLSLIAWYHVCSVYFEPAAAPAAGRPAMDLYSATPARSQLATPNENVQVAATSTASSTTTGSATARAAASAAGGTAVATAAAATAAAASSSGGGGGGGGSSSSSSTHAHYHAPLNAASCAPGRRPYHTLLTAQGSIYNQWQARSALLTATREHVPIEPPPRTDRSCARLTLGQSCTTTGRSSAPPTGRARR